VRNEELNNLFCSNITVVIKLRVLRRAGHVGCMGETINGYKIFAENPEGKKLFGYGQTEE
jgi:hypothetical protein